MYKFCAEKSRIKVEFCVFLDKVCQIFALLRAPDHDRLKLKSQLVISGDEIAFTSSRNSIITEQTSPEHEGINRPEKH